MSKIKNSILWILCAVNYVAHGIALSTLLLPNFKNEFMRTMYRVSSGVAFWYSVFISVFVAILGIVVLVCRWVKNRKVRVNEVVLLVLFAFGIFMVGCYYWCTYRYFQMY